MTPISFEFFPPKTDEQRAQLDVTVAALKGRRPEYVSVTFGAGGSTLSYTPDTIRRLGEYHGLDAVPHLSCMGGTRREIRELLDHYKDLGCRRVVALRGDLPSGMATYGDFRYASDLVTFIREETGDHFHIEVAGYPEVHPQAESAESDLRHLATKVKAGANGIITQYFFNPDAYFRFLDDTRRQGIDCPIVPGIMPISNYSQLKRFSDMCGAEIPRWISKRLQGMADDVASIREFGADVVAAMCKRLIAGGATALHIYTLNRARPTVALLERLDH
ncbi:methylenetetrahydrofolate reductase [NAD(P)H] [Pseudomarimonas arenosa]|uniref:Methylenetetrahydrofolate reductase n=1 Tax=Pseudomarimonas arenosa TaxID=2774145 RepID=A0AAW3ZD40_9GAMM|nr:methylenetetrahydrofolate reductase [NAD(P)H] [Pseudomarimonas arenosa]MBD8524218.1 methylenetetrahydrofolate reductase [NAD(P)H] [Pseudomarimonas arenosa]